MRVNASTNVAENATFIKKHKYSPELQEEGRQVVNSRLSPKVAYMKSGEPRMGLSREPSDFAYMQYIKAKTSAKTSIDFLA